jgi:hypothetical protein
LLPINASNASNASSNASFPDQTGSGLHPMLQIVPALDGQPGPKATGSDDASLTPEQMLSALRDINRPLYAIARGRSSILTDRVPTTFDGLTGVIPAVPIENLGSAAFRHTHNLRYAYVSGAMAGGIASVDLVVDMAQSGFLGFFGAGALTLPAIEQAIRQIQSRLPGGESYGVNLLHNFYDEQLEWATVELYLALGVTRI